MTDTIVKTVEIAAPVERVWRALTDHREFGQWFKARIDQPFVAGGESTGQMTYPGFEHFPWIATVVEIEPMRRFVFNWPATGGDETALAELATLERTRVEFVLEADGDGSRLTVTESGFEKLSPERRENVMRSNTGGWAQQMENIRQYVSG